MKTLNCHISRTRHTRIPSFTLNWDLVPSILYTKHHAISSTETLLIWLVFVPFWSGRGRAGKKVNAVTFFRCPTVTGGCHFDTVQCSRGGVGLSLWWPYVYSLLDLMCVLSSLFIVNTVEMIGISLRVILRSFHGLMFLLCWEINNSPCQKQGYISINFYHF